MDDGNREDNKENERGNSDGGGKGAEGLGTNWVQSSAHLARHVTIAEGAACQGRKRPSELCGRLIFKDKGMVPAERGNLESKGLMSSM